MSTKQLTITIAVAMILLPAAVFGLSVKASLGGKIWHDVNKNGVQDADEPSLAGVVVEVAADLNGDGVIDVRMSRKTDASGKYIFQTLLPATYTVTTDVSQLEPTYDLDGVQTPNKVVKPLKADKPERGADFGYVPPVEPPTQPCVTYTQGGWSGNTTKQLRNRFADVYPEGLMLGSNHWLRFDGGDEIRSFLPQGGPVGTLINNYDPPKKRTEAGAFAGQVLALRLNVDYSDAGLLPAGLAGLKITQGTFEGWTVGDLLNFAEEVLGGDSDDMTYTFSELSDACTAINENYCDGADKGYLEP
ncbi:MAG: SdrD B-like domain-containing protein [Armatimonadia bacterium]